MNSMKSLIADIIILALSVGMIVIGCNKSIVIDKNERLEPKVETYTPRTKSDTTEVEDTLVPITFSVTVDDWEEIDWN